MGRDPLHEIVPGMKRRRTLLRQDRWTPVLLLALTLMAIGGCRGKEQGRPASNGTAPAEEELEAGPYVTDGGVLYELSPEGRTALLALPGAGPAPDTLAFDSTSASALGAPKFRRLVLSPDSEAVAWEVGGAGSWVGVAGRLTRGVWLLNHWTGALPDTLIWSPVGRYLAVQLRHPDGRASVDVFDTSVRKRLALPWQRECEGIDACDVTEVRWVGGTLMDVEIRLGEDEPSVPFEVNVSELTPVSGPKEVSDERRISAATPVEEARSPSG